jgi:hypothetical protein
LKRCYNNTTHFTIKLHPHHHDHQQT